MRRKLTKREKKMLIALGIVALLGAVILFSVYKSSNKGTNPSNDKSKQKKEDKKKKTLTSHYSGGGGVHGSHGSSSGGGAISVTEFKKHRSMDDCWVLMNGEVYDITNFIHTYPEYKEDIVGFCGTFGFEAGFLKENPIYESIKKHSQKKGVIR